MAEPARLAMEATMSDSVVSSAVGPMVQDVKDSLFEYAVGSDVICERKHVWYAARVVGTSQRTKKRKVTTLYKVTYDGWGAKWDELVEDTRLRPRTAEAIELARASQQAASDAAEVICFFRLHRSIRGRRSVWPKKRVRQPLRARPRYGER